MLFFASGAEIPRVSIVNFGHSLAKNGGIFGRRRGRNKCRISSKRECIFTILIIPIDSFFQVLAEARDYLIKLSRMRYENKEKNEEIQGHLYAPVK